MKVDSEGKVYLVGSGPGDPGLLTIRARECIEQADVIIYDYLANEVFLDYAGSGVELIYVGKKGSDHTMGQVDINNLIIEKARSGASVVRLKGGDPFIFGRGGEEAQELVKAGIPFEVVPGVTSAIAVPAYAGIPLTHRDYTSTVAFITGHEDPTKEQSSISWEKLATGVGTLVFLMGVGNLSKIAESLMKHGRSGETPVAVIQRGTVAEQRSVTGPLREIAKRVEDEGIKPPAIIVVGEVVDLREELNWFETRSLYGKRILVTRAREQASEFMTGLSLLGAECIQFPTIQVVPPKNWQGLDRALMRMERYQWVIFTSVNGVKFYFERLEKLGLDVRELGTCKLGAIGPKTAEALRKRGLIPDLVPGEYRAEAIVACLKGEVVKGNRILLPRADQAREILPLELVNMGAIVDEIPVYRTVKPDQDKGRVKGMLEDGSIDMVTFTSSSTVRNFVDMFRESQDQLGKWMEKVVVACIGPITAKTAEDYGFSVRVMPEDYTIEALTEKIVRFFKRRES